MTATRPDWAAAVGRWMLALIFVLSALKKIAAPTAAVAVIGGAGAPLPAIAYALAVVVELAGATALIAGWHTRIAALGLAMFCLAAGLLIHAHPGDPAQMVHFMKNIAIAGGLLQVVAFGGGRIALDARADRASPRK